MKNICLALFLSSVINLNAQITISEILFEEPTWNTNLLYLELLNYSEQSVKLSEWSISGDLILPSLPNVNLLPGEHYLICTDLDAIFAFGLATEPDKALLLTGNQNFSIPNFILINPDGQVSSRIEYNSQLNWPVPDSGVSIELCDPTLNTNNGSNWSLAEAIVSVGNEEIIGTPGLKNTCSEISTSSTEIDLSNQIKLYPNPCNSILNIKFDGTIDLFEVYDMTGTQLLKVIKSNSIDVSSLNAGIYNIYVQCDGNEYYRKFVKF